MLEQEVNEEQDQEKLGRNIRPIKEKNLWTKYRQWPKIRKDRRYDWELIKRRCNDKGFLEKEDFSRCAISRNRRCTNCYILIA